MFTGSGESVLVIDRSAVRTGVLTVELLFAGVGSVVPEGAATVAVLSIEPVALAATVAVTVNVATAPLVRLIARLILPVLPVAGVPQLSPAATGATEQLQVGLVERC